MFSSLYTSLSGLFNFSKGLNILSNNISNLNTPGFKSSTTHFNDLVYKNSQQIQGQNNIDTLQIGNGVTLGSTRFDFQQGDITATGNDLNAAINGNGLFILRSEDRDLYTRSGQFQFDNDDFLVDINTGFKVLGINNNDQLEEINISDLRVSPAVATSEVTFVNNLSTGSTNHTVNNIDAFDSLGETHTFSLEFTNNTATTAGSWLFDLSDSTSAVLTSGEIRFNPSGTLQTGFNTHSFLFSPGGTIPTTITLNFGEPGSLSGSTSFSSGTTSTLSVDTQNGSASGSILSTTFNEDGVLNISYSNSDSVDSLALAMAWFKNIQDLVQFGSSLFINSPDNQPIISRANEGLNGSIEAASIELSNVDLTEEFTDLIVVQRGFQGSSQIISASNELIQELLDIRRG